jgi:hypothetical protein
MGRMTKPKRELIARPATNAPLVALSCEGCNWGVSMHPNGTDEVVRKTFDAHRCEDYPKEKSSGE